MKLDDIKANFPWFFGPPRCCSVCGATVSEHHYRPDHMSQQQPVEPTIYDHEYTDAETRLRTRPATDTREEE